MLFRETASKIICERPKSIAIIMLILVLISSVLAARLSFDASSDSLLMEGDESLEVFRKINKNYNTESFLVVTYSSLDGSSVFTDSHLKHISALQSDLEQLDTVSSVSSIQSVPLLYSPKVDISKLSDGFNTLSLEGVDRALAQEEFANSPLYKGLLTSENTQSTLLQVNISRNQTLESLREQKESLLRSQRSGEELSEDEKKELKRVEASFDQETLIQKQVETKLIHDVRAVMTSYQSNAKLFLGGVAMVSHDMLNYIQQDLIVFGLAVLGFVFLILGIVFRRLIWVILPLLSCVASVMLTSAMMKLMGWKLTVISANFVALLLILTLSVTVHLIVRYRELQVSDPVMEKVDRVKKMMTFMFVPCLFTTLTTIIAFMSLSVSGIRPVIDFGLMMTIGVILALCVAFLIIPIGIILWPFKMESDIGQAENKQPFTVYAANYVERYGQAILMFAGVVFCVSLFGLTKLKVENRFIDYFDKDTEIYQGMEMIDAQLGGSIPLDIIIRAPKDEDNEELYIEDDDFGSEMGSDEIIEEDGFDELLTDSMGDTSSSDDGSYWFTVQGLNEIKKIHDYIDQKTETGKVFSLAVLYQVIDDLLGGVDDLQLAVLEKNTPDIVRKTLVSPYINTQGEDETRLTVRVKETSHTLSRNELIQEIDSFLVNEMGYQSSQYDVSGLLVLYNNMLQSLFKSQILTLGAVFIAIMLMFLVLFRSIVIALIAITPNFLAAGLVLGMMGFLSIPLDMMTITIAAITVGIGVDNSIHYIYRYKKEFILDNDYLKAMHRSHRSIGRAMYYTSLTIIIGFMVLVLSNFTPSVYFGFLTSFAMLAAILGNLLVLPKMLITIKPFSQCS
jgi:uncharacterized protein